MVKRKTAEWLHEKWGIPISAYIESMNASLSGDKIQEWSDGSSEKSRKLFLYILHILTMQFRIDIIQIRYINRYGGKEGFIWH